MARSPVLSSLKPVVLANDDYDEDLTHVKEVARAEFAANNEGPYVHVSNTQSVQVTADNVNDIFADIVSSDTQESVFQGAQLYKIDENHDHLQVDNLLHLARTLPREMYISQVLRDSSSDRDRLDCARSEIFECIKATDGYPYDSRASLKKRIQTRTGDSVEYKLAQDLYCLSLVLDGADWDDLRDVVTIPRPTRKSTSQAAVDSSFQTYNISDLESLKRTVQNMASDLVILKQENTTIKSELRSEIKSLRSDLRQVNADCESELKELRSLITINALSIDRVCNERSNGVANIKGELKQIKSDVKALLEEPVLSVNVAEMKECMVRFNSFEKRLNRLDKRLQGEQPVTSIDLTKPNSPEQPRQALTDESFQTVHVNKQDNSVLVRSKGSNLFSRIDKVSQSNNMDATELSGQHISAKSKCNKSDLPTNDKSQNVPAYDADTVEKHSDRQCEGERNGKYSPAGTSAVLNRHNIVNIQSAAVPNNVQNLGSGVDRQETSSTVKLYSDVVSQGSGVGSASVGRQTDPSTTNTKTNATAYDKRSVPTYSNRVNNLSLTAFDRRDNTSDLFDDLQGDISHATRQKSIPVRVNGASADTIDYVRDRRKVYSREGELDCISLIDDVDVSEHVRKRTKRFYIGGFKPSITQAKLIKYVENKGLSVTWVNIWTSKRNGRVVIRLNVEASEHYQIIAEPGFWPPGIKCRPWVSKNKYNNSHLKAGRTRQYDEPTNDYQYTDDNGYFY